MARVYEFKCPECGEVEEADEGQVELFCGCSDRPVRLKRVFSLAGIRFKGSDFYRNEYETTRTERSRNGRG